MKFQTNNVVKEMGFTTQGKQQILRSCKDRKKVGWESLKGWDDSTKHNLQMSKEFIEKLFLRLEDELEMSFKRFETVSKFFAGFKVTMLSNAELGPKIDIFKDSQTQTLKSPMSLKNNDPLYYSMAEFNREYLVFRKHVETSMMRVEKEILNKVLGDQIKNYENSLKELYSKRETIKKQLKKRSHKTAQKLKKLTKIYNDSVSEKAKGLRVKHNCFDFASDFVNSVKSIDMLITDYGILLISMWEQCSILEEKRIYAIRQAFLKFTDIVREIFGSEGQKSFHKRCSKQFQIHRYLKICNDI